MREDRAIDYGYKYAQYAINNAPRDNTVFWWSAIPCVYGRISLAEPRQKITGRYGTDTGTLGVVSETIEETS